MQTNTNTEGTMPTETYNGWTNYATWGVKLVLDNEQATYFEVQEVAAQFKAEAETHPNVPGIWTADQAAQFTLVDWLKDYVEGLCGLEDDGDHLSLMARQVIQAGLADVNWDEIAENILSES